MVLNIFISVSTGVSFKTLTLAVCPLKNKTLAPNSLGCLEHIFFPTSFSYLFQERDLFSKSIWDPTIPIFLKHFHLGLSSSHKIKQQNTSTIKTQDRTSHILTVLEYVRIIP